MAHPRRPYSGCRKCWPSTWTSSPRAIHPWTGTVRQSMPNRSLCGHPPTAHQTQVHAVSSESTQDTRMLKPRSTSTHTITNRCECAVRIHTHKRKIFTNLPENIIITALRTKSLSFLVPSKVHVSENVFKTEQRSKPALLRSPTCIGFAPVIVTNECLLSGACKWTAREELQE